MKILLLWHGDSCWRGATQAKLSIDNALSLCLNYKMEEPPSAPNCTLQEKPTLPQQLEPQAIRSAIVRALGSSDFFEECSLAEVALRTAKYITGNSLPQLHPDDMEEMVARLAAELGDMGCPQLVRRYEDLRAQGLSLDDRLGKMWVEDRNEVGALRARWDNFLRREHGDLHGFSKLSLGRLTEPTKLETLTNTRAARLRSADASVPTAVTPEASAPVAEESEATWESFLEQLARLQTIAAWPGTKKTGRDVLQNNPDKLSAFLGFSGGEMPKFEQGCVLGVKLVMIKRLLHRQRGEEFSPSLQKNLPPRTWPQSSTVLEQCPAWTAEDPSVTV